MYISRITGYNQNSFSLSRRQINNPSFEAKKPKELAKLASVTAAALGIPIHFQKINEKEAECEIYKIRQGKLLLLQGIMKNLQSLRMNLLLY